MKTLRTYLELVRIPNVFTALADVLAGYWLVSDRLHGSAALGWMLAASACLYSAGIVFNDIHDVETDRRERPGRPIPSGRVSLRTAWAVAVVLSFIGLAAAALALRSRSADETTASGGAVYPLAVAALLLLSIAAYDFALKSTVLGPVSMGLCRGVNLLMAMSLGWWFDPTFFALGPAVLFLYVASMTYFGRQETEVSSRRRLINGAAGIAVSLGLLGILAGIRIARDLFALVLWLALCIHAGRLAVRAIRNPSPARVQYAMKHFILGIIVFDAVIATAAHGWPAGAIVLSLLVPAITLGRWVYTT